MSTDMTSENGQEMRDFTSGELAQIRMFARKIDIMDRKFTALYGAGAQKHMEDISQLILEHSRKEDQEKAVRSVDQLLAELTGGPVKKGILGLFQKKRSLPAADSESIDSIACLLEGHQEKLFRDLLVLKKIEESNRKSVKELSMYVASGRIALEGSKVDLDTLKAGNTTASDHLVSMKINDLEDACRSFEKKLYDLELTKAVGEQNSAQIQLMQSNAAILNDRIQTALVTTIPLWKKQL